MQSPVASSLSPSAPPNFDESRRQQALDALRLVGSLPEPDYDDVVKIAAAICETPIALITLLDRDRQWFKATHGVDGQGTAREHAVCDHAIRQAAPLMEVEDLNADARFADNPEVAAIGARFYAGAPLVTPEGAAIGTVCVIDRTPRTLNATQRTALEALARLTMHLMQHRSGEHDRQVDRILHDAIGLETAASPETAGDYAVVILEVQDLATVERRIGHRLLERELEHLDRELEACLDQARGDSINRVTGSGEFIAVLGAAQCADTMERLDKAIAAAKGRLGVPMLLAHASSRAGEATASVFKRAEKALATKKETLRPEAG